MSKRIRLELRGLLQGVGFRPTVFRVATKLQLRGFVKNTPSGASIEIQGLAFEVDRFASVLDDHLPNQAKIDDCTITELDCVEEPGFRILESTEGRDAFPKTPPDLRICRLCTCDVLDPRNRRYRYAFATCTDCGPRFTITRSLPFDRNRTTMGDFEMCESCESEYRDSSDRRFHSQTNSCGQCGPVLTFLDNGGKRLSANESALSQAAAAIRTGSIVAIKGLGGFHLFCDARNPEVILKLRKRKGRDSKPFAIMMRSVEETEKYCIVSDIEKQILDNDFSPIVILKKREQAFELGDPRISPFPTLGVMLAYSPLHVLLLDELGFPCVATSGNLADDPICTRIDDALSNLDNIADFFLTHDREISFPADDSVVCAMAGSEVVIRAGRGYAPLRFPRKNAGEPFMALGPHQKNSLAIALREEYIGSPHIGSLSTESALGRYHQVRTCFEKLAGVQARSAVHDLHPDYATSVYGHEHFSNTRSIQHHEAHAYSVLLEHALKKDTLCVTWDGTGLGRDGTIWGGEFFLYKGGRLSRVATLREFPVLGGDQASRQPRRSAFGVLWAMGGATYSRLCGGFTQIETRNLERIFGTQAVPLTTSVGRLFDAVGSLMDLGQVDEMEAQTAMKLQFLAQNVDMKAIEPHSITFIEREILVIDWEPWIADILEARFRLPAETISARFHKTLAEAITLVADRFKISTVALSGGCFQNKVLLEETARLGGIKGLAVYWNQKIPSGDGGISLGQAFAADSAVVTTE